MNCEYAAAVVLLATGVPEIRPGCVAKHFPQESQPARAGPSERRARPRARKDNHRTDRTAVPMEVRRTTPIHSDIAISDNGNEHTASRTDAAGVRGSLNNWQADQQENGETTRTTINRSTAAEVD